MPKKDISRLAVERASSVLYRALSSLHEKIPYGPGNVQLSTGEMNKLLRNAQPDVRMQILQQLRSMGDNGALQAVLGIPDTQAGVN
jgi:hypothetical protein